MGLGIHELDEGLNRTGGSVGKGVGRIIGRLDHHGVNEFLDRENFLFLQPNLSPADL